MREVVVVYNRPGHAAGAAAEHGVIDSVDAVVAALAAAGDVVRTLPIDDDLAALEALRIGRPPDAVINLCESFGGRAEGEPWVAAWLEAAGIGFSGSPADCLTLVRHKPRAKWLLRGAGLATPEAWLVTRDAPPPRAALVTALASGPLIVKPAGEDASLGLSQRSVVTDITACETQIDAMQAAFGEVLVERYVAGREFNLAVLDGEPRRVLPIAEIAFVPRPGAWPIVSYDAKWTPDSADYAATPVVCPAQIDPPLADRLRQIALHAFAACGARDYARVDLRVDAAGEPFVLEVNANPDICPDAGFARALRVAGIDYRDFVDGLVTAAMRRSRRPAAARHVSPRRTGATTVRLRELRASDVEPLVEILRVCGVFRPDEVDVGREVLEEAARDGQAAHYHTTVAEHDGRPIGFECHGLVPMTDATWDLYWIAVDPRHQGLGIGARLAAHCEAAVRAAGGRWVLAETSGSDSYLPTRAFYLRSGYAIVGCVPDAYRQGDARVTFGKRVDRPGAP